MRELTQQLMEEFIRKNSLPKKMYKKLYYVFIQELSDNSLAITFVKGYPSKLWDFIYRKYYHGTGNPYVATLYMNRNKILIHYAAHYLKESDKYTHENYIHLYLINHAVLNKNTLYFYFRKSQYYDIVQVLNRVYNIPQDEIKKLLSEIITKGDSTPKEIILRPPQQKLQPVEKFKRLKKVGNEE